MTTITAAEASRNFSAVLDRAENGETFTLTRHGRVVATLNPARRRTGRDLRLALEAARAEPGRLTDDTLEADIAEGLSFVIDEGADPWDAA